MCYLNLFTLISAKCPCALEIAHLKCPPWAPESPVHTLNRDGEPVLQEMRGGLETLFPGPAPGFLSISWDK